MSFIRFRNQMINAQWIRKIVIEPTRYRIYINNTTHDGFMRMGTGALLNDSSIVVIDKEKHQHDYDIMQKWISTN